MKRDHPRNGSLPVLPPRGLAHVEAGDEDPTGTQGSVHPHGRVWAVSLPGAEMTPDVLVWIATARNKISFHLITPDWRHTDCGRWIGYGYCGSPELSAERGHILPLAEVQDRFGSQPCRQCTGDLERVAPKVRPSRDAPWV